MLLEKTLVQRDVEDIDKDDEIPTALIFNKEFPIPSTPQAFDISTLFNKVN